jgi:single-strand DNA-binding protein
MPFSFNDVKIAGHAGNDADLRYTPNSMAITNVSLALSTRKKNEKDEWVDGETTWIEVKMFGKLAEKYGKLPKGAFLIVFGRLNQEKWEKDNVKHSKHVVIADKVFVIPKEGEKDAETEETADSEIPF